MKRGLGTLAIILIALIVLIILVVGASFLVSKQFDSDREEIITAQNRAVLDSLCFQTDAEVISCTLDETRKTADVTFRVSQGEASEAIAILEDPQTYSMFISRYNGPITDTQKITVSYENATIAPSELVANVAIVVSDEEGNKKTCKESDVKISCVTQ